MKSLLAKLLISLLVFTVVIISVITYINRLVLVQNIKAQQQENWQLVEEHIISDMRIVDRAHLYIDQMNAQSTEQELRKLVRAYEGNPDVMAWDIEAIKKRVRMDLFIIDDQNRIIRSTLNESLGVDFEECCEKFARLLDERRTSGLFYLDGIDSSVAVNELWQYSYQGTPDQKFIFEFGMRLVDSPIHVAFNYFDTVNNLINNYEDLLDIKIINHEGIFLNTQDELKSVSNLSLQQQETYYLVKEDNKAHEVEMEADDGRVITHRFIPYIAESQRGISTERIIYMRYSNEAERTLLRENTKQFWLLLIIGILTACVLLVIIMRIFMKTIQLATFDALTGAYNRASYLNHMDQLIQRNDKQRIGLLLIDLDNFKQVNDQFGHLEGDEILKQMTKILQAITGKSGYVVRFGGDEFGIVFSSAKQEKLQEVAEQILGDVRSMKGHNTSWQLLSVSIGGAIQEEQKEAEVSLFMRADKALYESKNLGKDRYTFVLPVDKVELNE